MLKHHIPLKSTSFHWQSWREIRANEFYNEYQAYSCAKFLGTIPLTRPPSSGTLSRRERDGIPASCPLPAGEGGERSEPGEG
ncbi:MAG TPA: hypothetical protein VGX94_03310, partial [Terriglobia bacterium]|nr:hypothetical protein [Terriglobia bacterium]